MADSQTIDTTSTTVDNTDTANNQQDNNTTQATNNGSTSSTATTEVRDPNKLLELYNQQKDELKELRNFKTKQEQEKSKAEQERLQKEQQYEALIPLKVKEAVEPIQSNLTKVEQEKAKLQEKLAQAEKKYQDLQTEIKVSKSQDVLYTEFLSANGDPKTSKETLWKLYGDKVTFDDKGSVQGVSELFKSLQSDDFGSKLFIVSTPSGSGTSPQGKSNVTTNASSAPRVVTKAMLLSPRKHGFTMDDITTGKVVVEE